MVGTGTEDFMRSFSTCFALLGLKLLFGNKQVTIGSVVLLGAVSGAVASVWTGGGNTWVDTLEDRVANALSTSPLVGHARDLLYTFVCRVGVVPPSLSGRCPTDAEEPVRDEL